MKKILIALVSVALLAGCSADGLLVNGSTLEAPDVKWSNDTPTPPSGTQYCYYNGDCDLIGGIFTSSLSACSSKGGIAISYAECVQRGAYIYDI